MSVAVVGTNLQSITLFIGTCAVLSWASHNEVLPSNVTLEQQALISAAETLSLIRQRVQSAGHSPIQQSQQLQANGSEELPLQSAKPRLEHSRNSAAWAVKPMHNHANSTQPSHQPVSPSFFHHHENSTQPPHQLVSPSALQKRDGFLPAQHIMKHLDANFERRLDVDDSNLAILMRGFSHPRHPENYDFSPTADFKPLRSIEAAAAALGWRGLSLLIVVVIISVLKPLVYPMANMAREACLDMHHLGCNQLFGPLCIMDDLLVLAFIGTVTSILGWSEEISRSINRLVRTEAAAPLALQEKLPSDARIWDLLAWFGNAVLLAAVALTVLSSIMGALVCCEVRQWHRTERLSLRLLQARAAKCHQGRSASLQVAFHMLRLDFLRQLPDLASGDSVPTNFRFSDYLKESLAQRFESVTRGTSSSILFLILTVTTLQHLLAKSHLTFGGFTADSLSLGLLCYVPSFAMLIVVHQCLRRAYEALDLERPYMPSADTDGGTGALGSNAMRGVSSSGRRRAAALCLAALSRDGFPHLLRTMRVALLHTCVVMGLLLAFAPHYFNGIHDPWLYFVGPCAVLPCLLISTWLPFLLCRYNLVCCAVEPPRAAFAAAALSSTQRHESSASPIVLVAVQTWALRSNRIKNRDKSSQELLHRELTESVNSYQRCLFESAYNICTESDTNRLLLHNIPKCLEMLGFVAVSPTLLEDWLLFYGIPHDEGLSFEDFVIFCAGYASVAKKTWTVPQSMEVWRDFDVQGTRSLRASEWAELLGLLRIPDAQKVAEMLVEEVMRARLQRFPNAATLEGKATPYEVAGILQEQSLQEVGPRDD